MRAIFRGRYVVDIDRGVNKDAAILVDDGTIVDVGSMSDIRRRAGNESVREFDGILLPALINAHTHLELSALRKDQFHHSDFVDWVIKLVDTRTSMLSVDQRPDCLRAKRLAEANGTGYFVNVGNDFDLNSSLGDNQLFAFEQIGINESSADKVLARSGELVEKESSVQTALAVHAPYSVSPVLMRGVKAFNNSRGAVTSIHLAETSDENEFVMSGTGRMADLLNYRVGKWEFDPRAGSSVRYVDSLGMLDEKTLCVHCVFVDEKDIETLSERKSSVAVCIRSNRELSGHVPPVEKFLKKGVRILVGTDSLASSPDIDMFSEISAFYSEFHDIVGPDRVFAAATCDAAEFLGISERYGSISPGKKGDIVYVPFDGSEKDVFEFIVADAHDKTRMVEA